MLYRLGRIHENRPVIPAVDELALPGEPAGRGDGGRSASAQSSVQGAGAFRPAGRGFGFVILPKSLQRRPWLAGNRPVLLWRTKMTVNSIGVNMPESVPPLIASAAPYFGRDMEVPMLVSKRISRAGQVEIGEAKVVEDEVKTPPAANGRKKP